NFELAQAEERIENLNSNVENTLAYATPEVEQGFAYNFELAQAEERIENLNSNVENTLTYAAPQVEHGFDFDFETARTTERIENQLQALQMSLQYVIPADSDGINKMESIHDTENHISGFYSFKSIKITWPVAAFIKVSH
ncbi:MAG: hypothetical protein JXA61_01920, partial [Bacteroidales bacterium]|nr:hypothetical protein [Bacteroidales bacterium]